MTTIIGNTKDDQVISETSGKLMEAGRWQVFGQSHAGAPFIARSGIIIGLGPERVSHSTTQIGLMPQMVARGGPMAINRDGGILGMIRQRVSNWTGR